MYRTIIGMIEDGSLAYCGDGVMELAEIKVDEPD